jgi:hypothetical protein
MSLLGFMTYMVHLKIVCLKASWPHTNPQTVVQSDVSSWDQV